MFETTHQAFLSRLARHDGEAWRHFVVVYGPLIRSYGLKSGLQGADVDDVVQSVWQSLSESLPRFRYDPERGRFRDYLGRIAANAVRRFHANRAARRSTRLDTDVARHLVDDGDFEDLFLEEWRTHHCQAALAALRRELSATSLDVFTALLEGADIASCMQRFDLSRDAVYKIRDRVRLRLEARIREQMHREDDYFHWA